MRAAPPLAAAPPVAVAARPPDTSDIERRVSLALLAACVAVAALLLVNFPPFYETYDDAKYISLGLNLLEGNGPITDFGNLFVNHSPVWALIIAAPQHFLGVPAVSVAHVLNGLFVLGTLVLTGGLAWRFRPYAGALAAIALTGFPYVHNMARTAGLDLPSVFFTLAFLLAGSLAFRRASARLAIAAGALFALAFLFKETALPFAPVPIAVGILVSARWRDAARQAAWLLLAASVGLAWWFAMYAHYTGLVYRFGTPAWTLVPLTIAIVTVVVGGLAAGRIADAADARGVTARLATRVPGQIRAHGRSIAAWGLALAWTASQAVLFARAGKLAGQPMVRIEAWTAYVETWDRTLGLIAAFGLGGLLLLVSWRLAGGRDTPARPILEGVLATLCGLPLVLLVVGIGETPRHYIAWLAVVVALAAIGWIAVLSRAIGERSRVAAAAVVGTLALAAVVAWPTLAPVVSVARVAAVLAVAGIVAVLAVVLLAAAGPTRRAAIRARAPELALPVLLVVALVGSGTVLALRSATENEADAARETAVTATAAWIRDNVPAGSTIAFGQFLGTDLSLALRDDYVATDIRAGAAIADPTAPVGLRRGKAPPSDAWIAADAALRNATQYVAHSPGTLLVPFQRSGATWYVFPTSSPDGASPFLPPLRPDLGFEEVHHAVYPAGPEAQIDVHVFRVDPARLGWDPTRLYFSPEALEQMLPVLEADPAASRETAGRILDRLVLVPDDPATSGPLLARLHAVAGR